MTGDKSLLTEVVLKAGPIVTFGDDSKGVTKGYGNLVIGNVIVRNVSYVEGLKHNLLSISQLCDRGYEVTFSKKGCSILHKKDDILALSGVRKGNLFIADMNSSVAGKVTCFYGKASSDESWLWHKRLSHLNFKAMNALVRRELVRGLPPMEFISDGLCEACQFGKSKHTAHKDKEFSSITEPLQLVHMDLFGPVNVLSMSRKRYTLVMVDDFSKYTWVVFVATKDEVPQEIIKHIIRT